MSSSSPGPSAAVSNADEPSPSLDARLRLLGGALGAGVGVGVVTVGAASLTVGVEPAADTAFLVGTLAFGFGLLGWAGSIIAGQGLETMQAHLDTSSGWTEADSRRAMARIGGFGVGLMLAAVVVGTALGYT